VNCTSHRRGRRTYLYHLGRYFAKYRLRFDPPLKLVRTGNDEEDIVSNTQLFTKIIEDYVRRHPEQWLWVHRRWKTRPPGDPSLY
jgi:KDO2-lipid IV(A) lauroyltransferase